MSNKPIIVLDPGHNSAKSNPSPVVPAYCEGQRMWDLAQLLKSALEEYGIEVRLTKSRVDEALDVTTRGRMARGCTCLISLHSNACGTESVDRPEGIYFVDDDCGEIDAESERLAVLLAQTVAGIMGTTQDARQYSRRASGDRDGDGRANDDYYGVLYGAHQVGVPAIILEHSFHTNTRAAEWLMDAKNLRELAEAEAFELANYYSLVDPDTGFTDVRCSDWFFKAVQWAVENGITSGVDRLHFAPNDTCTRAQAVTMLWRLFGSPEPEGGYQAYTDVQPTAYYAKAVQWAQQKGITEGTGNGKFGPDEPCTRAQIVTFLHRSQGKPNGVFEYMPFDDVAPSAWYSDAVAWAYGAGIVQGIGDHKFAPNDPCTRAQMVTFLIRLAQM